MERAIEVSTTVRAPVAACTDLLSSCALALVGEPVAGDGSQVRIVLRVEGSHGLRGLHQAVACHVGTPRVHAGHVIVHVRWSPLGHERWLPSFDGELGVSASPTREGTTLRLRGCYTLPLGPLGHFGDGVIGHRVARRVLTSFLEDVAARIEQSVASEINIA